MPLFKTIFSKYMSDLNAFKLEKARIPMVLIFFAVAIVGLVLLLKVRSIQVLFPLVLLAYFAFLWNRSRKFQISLLDLGFIILLLSEIMSTCGSSYFYNSISALTRFLVLLFLYIVYKVITTKYNVRIYISYLFFILSSALIVFTVLSFKEHYQRVLSEGFLELNNFKNLYVPLKAIGNRISSNTWSSALLIFLSCNLIFLLNRKTKLAKALVLFSLLLNTFAIVISFSRGLYVSIITFLFALNLLLFFYLKLRKLVVFNIVAIIFILLSVAPVKKSFYTTVQINKTNSQKRSTEGRLILWANALKLAKEKPILGYGQKNFRLARVSRSNSKGGDIITSNKTFNTYVQLVIERGIFGFCCYLIFFLIVLFIVYRNLKSKEKNLKEKIEVIIISSAIFAYLVREVTFSTFFDTDLIYFLVFYLIFGLVPHDIKFREVNLTRNTKLTLSSIGVLVIVSILFINLQIFMMTQDNNRFVRSYYRDDIANCLKFISKALSRSPDDIDLNEHKALGLSKQSLQMEISASNEFLLKFYNPNVISLHEALISFKKVLTQKPFDDELIHSIGWIKFASGNLNEAKKYFIKASIIDPYESRYHISLLLVNIQNSDFANVRKNLKNALMYDPAIIESQFYHEFSLKYPDLTRSVLDSAIESLDLQLNLDNDVIVKARLARLLLSVEPSKAEGLLLEVTSDLPNLTRPWIYLAYLNSVRGDFTQAIYYYDKAFFVSNTDYLSNLYKGNYYRERGIDDKAVRLYMRALKSYPVRKTFDFTRNSSIPNLKIIPMQNIATDMLYYLKPKINASEIFSYFGEYYSKQNNYELSKYYKELSQEYENKLLKNEIHLR